MALKIRKRMGFKLYPRRVVAKPSFWRQHPPSFSERGFPRYPKKVRIYYKACQVSAEKNQIDVNMGERKTAP
jgi:hypothetical protein